MKLKNASFLATFFTTLLLFSSQICAFEVPPEWKFKKISTPHFDIIYNSAQQDLGKQYAHRLEKSYSLLSQVFTVMPEKTLVIINDKTDATNGYATRIPYPHIMTYPVLPGPQESLSESGDWSLELLAHEYTHILNFEPATGIFRVLRGVLGSISSPNLLLPTWWKEGLAVQTESMLNVKGGRLKSLYQDAIIRAMVDENTLFSFDIAEVNEAIPSWPEGSRPYIFGSIFWSQAVHDYGPRVMNDLNLRHSSRIPYFIEAPAKDLLKNDYESFYKKALEETNKRAQAQIAQLKISPITPTHPLPIESKYSSAPAISDDGQYLAMVSVDYKSDRVMDILIRDSETNTITKRLEVEIKKEDEPLVPSNFHQDGPPSGSIQKLAWFHKSPKLIYDQLRYVNRTERYSDLHTYDLATRKSERLTTALRAREPSVSPQDDKVVFVKLEGGRTHLGLYDLASKKATVLYSPPLQDRLSSPTYLDEDRIIFARRNSQGEEGLWIYSLAKNTLTPVLTRYEQARFPVLTKNGLMFTAANNGVHNLYLADSNLSKARPLTHSLTMVGLSALDPVNEHLYVSTMKAAGPAVVRIAKDSWQKTPAELPRIEGLFADRYQTPLSANTSATKTLPEETETYAVSDYSPWGYLWPRYWIPYVWTSPEGGLTFQAQTSGFDPLKKHNYDLIVGWNTFLKAMDWSAAYLNNTTRLPVQVAAAQTHTYLVNRENLVKDTQASLAGSPDLWSFSDHLSMSAGWRYIERSLAAATPTKRTGPFLTFTYKNITQGGEQFTPQDGGGAYITAVDYIAGRDLMDHSQYQAGGVYYFSSFLPKLHALVLRGSVLYTPEKIAVIYGTESDSMDFYGVDLSPKFLARGYSTGQFIGRSMYNTNLEYRFNLRDMYRGFGTYAFFARRLYAAATVDGLATDGLAIDPVTELPAQVKASEIFWSYGLEAHLETTVGYEFPLNFVLGLYKGTNQKYAPNPTLGLAIQFGGF